MPSTWIVGDIIPTNDLNPYSFTKGGVAKSGSHSGYRGMSGVAGVGTPAASPISTIEYINIGVFSDAVDWGEAIDMTYGYGCASNGVRAVSMGGAITGGSEVRDDSWYKNFASSGNSIDWGGEISQARNSGENSVASDGNRGVMSGGAVPASGSVDTMDYFVLGVPGSNAVDFGEIIQAMYHSCCSQDGSRGMIMFGRPNGGNVATLQYFRIGSTSDAIDFGEAYQGVARALAAVDDGSRAVNAGGRDRAEGLDGMDYVTIGTTSNSIDFGELTEGRFSYHSGSNNGHRGLFYNGRADSPNTVSINSITIGTTCAAVDFGEVASTHTGEGGSSGL